MNLNSFTLSKKLIDLFDEGRDCLNGIFRLKNLLEILILLRRSDWSSFLSYSVSHKLLPSVVLKMASTATSSTGGV